jgi:hypothetical protein
LPIPQGTGAQVFIRAQPAPQFWKVAGLAVDVGSFDKITLGNFPQLFTTSSKVHANRSGM